MADMKATPEEKLSSGMLELLEQDEVQEALKPEFTDKEFGYYFRAKLDAENSWTRHLLGGVMYVGIAFALFALPLEMTVPYGLSSFLEGNSESRIVYMATALFASALSFYLVPFKAIADRTVNWFAKTKFQLKYKKQAPTFDLEEMAKAVKILSHFGPSATQDDVVDVATLMREGVYVPKNVDVAYKLMKQLGLGGNAAASFTVYMAYREGRINVSKDESKRLQAEWFDRALAQGFCKED